MEKEPKKLPEIDNDAESSEKLHNGIVEKESTSREKEIEISNHNAEKARASIEEIASRTEEVPTVTELSEDKKDDDVRWTSQELLAQTYQRTLSHVRNRLSKPEKKFSKTIHQPVVEKSSEIIGSTIARPSGILFGGLFSFIGSLAGYLIARQLGGELPYSIFALLFVGGFAIGLIIELIIYLFKSKKR